MSDEPTPMAGRRKTTIYKIRIRGRLDDHWSDWFDGLTITPREGGDTLLTGPVIDDAALHGLLKKVRDLEMPLISVNRVEPDQGDVNKGLQYRSVQELTDQPP